MRGRYETKPEISGWTIYDAATGKLLRFVQHVGTTPTIMVTP